MGHCLFFDNLHELQSYLGVGLVVLSKLALIIKLDGSAKQRLVWDLPRSDVNSTVSFTERIAMPRLEGGKHLLRVHDAVESWTWPTHSTTYRYVRPSDSSCAERSALGSSSSKFSAWVESRHPISATRLQRPFVAWCLCEIYVDDHLLVAGGGRDERSRTFLVALLAVAVLGFSLALGQSQSR